MTQTPECTTVSPYLFYPDGGWLEGEAAIGPSARIDISGAPAAPARTAGAGARARLADVTHFHRVFRQAYGSTPAQPRRGRAREYQWARPARPWR